MRQITERYKNIKTLNIKKAVDEAEEFNFVGQLLYLAEIYQDLKDYRDTLYKDLNKANNYNNSKLVSTIKKNLKEVKGDLEYLKNNFEICRVS